MQRRLRRLLLRFMLICALVALGSAGTTPVAQSAQSATRQKIDVEYTAKIKELLQDPRISTELVDHLPASDTVPSPLKFFTRACGHARRVDLRERHLPLLRSARQGFLIESVCG